MSGRRFAALGLAAAMLHLSAARADVACAAHAGHAAPAGIPAAHDMEGMSDHSSRDTQCDTPSQQDCCEALAACSVMIGAGEVVRATEQTRVADRAPGVAEFAPLSRVTAPDPPPPKS